MRVTLQTGSPALWLVKVFGVNKDNRGGMFSHYVINAATTLHREFENHNTYPADFFGGAGRPRPYGC